jgi:pimeloyl-ACP methyl ester carboxylesterase
MTILGTEHGFLEVEPHDPAERRPDRDVVLLLHGLGGTKDDWRFPVVRDLHFDLSRAPPDRHDDNHLTPPLSPLDHLPEFGVSPLRTDVRCWTGVLKALGHTVVNYSQDGPQRTVDVPLEQFERRIVPFLRSDVLTGRLAGKRVVVLCHSRGGILIRAYLHRHPDEGRAWIGRVVTLCSPHQGTRAPVAKQKLADAAAAIGAGVVGPTSLLIGLTVRVLNLLEESAGANQLLPDSPLFAELATPAGVPGVDFRTIGGSSVRYGRIYAFFYTPDSYVPNWSDFPDVRFDWTKVPVEVPVASPLLDSLPDRIVDEEQDDGKGDGLVANSKAGMAGAAHESFPVNHAEALWDERLFARVARLLGTPLTGGETVRCGREPRGLAIVPATVSFGSVALGATARRTVRIENTGEDRVTVRVAASPPGVFQWAAVDAELPGGEGLTLSLSFAPADRTIRTELVRIISSAPGGPHILSLGGKGGIGGFPTPPPDPPLPTRLSYNSTLLNFGSVAVGAGATRQLLIRNGTGRSVAVRIAPSAAGAIFRWSGLDRSIAHNAEASLTVTFRPAAKVISTGHLTVESATAISPERIDLLGKGGIGGFPTPPP